MIVRPRLFLFVTFQFSEFPWFPHRYVVYLVRFEFEFSFVFEFEFVLRYGNKRPTQPYMVIYQIQKVYFCQKSTKNL